MATKKRTPAQIAATKRMLAARKATLEPIRRPAKKRLSKKPTARPKPLKPARSSSPPKTRAKPPRSSSKPVKRKAPAPKVKAPKRKASMARKRPAPAPKAPPRRPTAAPGVSRQSSPPVSLSVPAGPSKAHRALKASLAPAGWFATAVLGVVYLFSRKADAAPPLPAATQPDSPNLDPITIEPEPVTPNPTNPAGSFTKGATRFTLNGRTYKRLSSLTESQGVPAGQAPILGTTAATHLKFPMGHVEAFAVDKGGKLYDGANLGSAPSDATHYASALEEHFHPPGGAAKPWGKHKGVSLFIEEK